MKETIPFNLEVEYGPLLELIIDNISTMELDGIAHAGVKGMKWGVRKDRTPSAGSQRVAALKGLGPDKIVRTTPSGETITLSKIPPNGINKLSARMSSKFVDHYNKMASVDILDGNGKKVGGANFAKDGEDSLYLNIIDIQKSARGRGYATQALKAAEQYGKDTGIKRMTLDVPFDAPDAQHIYTKMGFKETHRETGPEFEGTYGGGLIGMEYRFDSAKHSFSQTESSNMSDTIGDGSYEDYLAHFGVKGMKWGKRKASSDGDAKPTRKERNAEIKNARKRIGDQVKRHDVAMYEANMGVSSKDRQKGRDKASRILRELEESGDDKIAAKYTTGEKVVTALMFGAAGAAIVAQAASSMANPSRY